MDCWKDEMKEILANLNERRDSEPFRQPVDWVELGLTDYLTIIKSPMDLSTVSKNLKKSIYHKKEECIRDIRLIWSNAMIYNATGSKLYNTAQNLSEYFEELLGERFRGKSRPPSITECTELIESCYKLTPEELSQVISLIDQKSSSALRKKIDENEILIDIDLISSSTYHEIISLIYSFTSPLPRSTSTSEGTSNKKRSEGGGAKSSSGSGGGGGDSLATIKKRKITEK